VDRASGVARKYIRCSVDDEFFKWHANEKTRLGVPQTGRLVSIARLCSGGTRAGARKPTPPSAPLSKPAAATVAALSPPSATLWHNPRQRQPARDQLRGVSSYTEVASIHDRYPYEMSPYLLMGSLSHTIYLGTSLMICSFASGAIRCCFIHCRMLTNDGSLENGSKFWGTRHCQVSCR
jgi:hypothetical protein